MNKIIAFLTSVLWLLMMLNIENISEMFNIDEVFLTYIMLFVGFSLILIFSIIISFEEIERENNER